MINQRLRITILGEVEPGFPSCGHVDPITTGFQGDVTVDDSFVTYRVSSGTVCSPGSTCSDYRFACGGADGDGCASRPANPVFDTSPLELGDVVRVTMIAPPFDGRESATAARAAVFPSGCRGEWLFVMVPDGGHDPTLEEGDPGWDSPFWPARDGAPPPWTVYRWIEVEDAAACPELGADLSGHYICEDRWGAEVFPVE